MKLLIIIGLFTFFSSNAISSSRLNLSYTTRQIEDGVRSQAFFIHNLVCVGNYCNLKIQTMNMCILGKFYPRVEEFSTKERDLKVIRKGKVTIEVTATTVMGEYIQEVLTVDQNTVTTLTGKVTGKNIKLILNNKSVDGEKFDCPMQTN